MTYAQISALLDKYWEGESSLEEERLLKAYFNNPGADERLKGLAPLFQALRDEQAIELKRANLARLRPRRLRWQRWAVAASIAALLSVGGWWAFQQRQAQVAAATQEDSFEDPEKAAAEIKAALALVSSKLNKGKREAAKGLKRVDTVDKFFKKKPAATNK